MARPSVDSRSTARPRGRLAAALRRRWIRLRHRGTEVECPCCASTWAAFAADWNRADAICPGCGAHERHRALWLYLRDRIRVGEGPHETELLHFAPEHGLRGLLGALPRVRLVTADLNPAGVDVQADITALPFPPATFDAVLCSHVLEHVPDDRAAMSEIARVLRPGGWALVLVPLDAGRDQTYEDPAITDPEDREREFWQHDHVRLYALDIADRLAAVGLAVRVERVVEGLPAGSARRYGLQPDETIFHCTRPPSLGT